MPDEEVRARAEVAFLARADRRQLELAVSLYERAAALAPADSAVLAALARACFLLADTHLRSTGDAHAMLASLERGIDAGERAMLAASPDFAARIHAGERVEEAVRALGPEGLPAATWYVANLGRAVIEKGFTTQVFYRERLFVVLQRLAALDPAFFHAAPHRLLGLLYAKAPVFAGRDLKKAREHFERAVGLSPEYLGNKLLFAEMYATEQADKELFVRLLGEVKAAQPSAVEIAPENQLDQRRADELLRRVDELF